MKKEKLKLFVLLILLILVLISGIAVLNTKVAFYQGVNYEIRLVKIPLYLKIIDFFSRHFHYRELAGDLTKGHKDDFDKIFVLFDWSQKNIRRAPEGLPIIDDHVWHVIVRGYGTDDQVHDVFTTLCNYSGLEAFFEWIDSSDKTRRMPLSFIKINNKWYIFDPYYGVYFEDINNKPVDIKSIKEGNYFLSKKVVEVNYEDFVMNIPDIDKIGLRRANTQSPLNRITLQIKKYLTK